MSRFRLATVRTIAAKELREAFRDRRTLFLMVLLPVILYPLLLLLLTQVASVQQQKLEDEPSAIVVRGGGADHPLVAYLADDEELELTVAEPDAIEGSGGALGAEGGADVVLDLSGWPTALDDESSAHVEIEYESVDEASRLAVDRVEQRLTGWSDEEIRRRLDSRGLDEAFVEPVVPELVDRADKTRRGGYLLGSILPLFIILTVLLGAFYPAIDLTAGEKERGSIQTLFTAPISTLEIVAGKYLSVLTISLISGLANLASLALLFGQSAALAGELSEEIQLSLSPSAVIGLFASIVLVGVFFSALLMTVAVLARSFKEAQNYLTPVYLLCIIPAMIAQLPGFSLDRVTALVPAVNVTLLMKQVLIDGVQAGPMLWVSGSSLLYTALILVVAGRVFGQERVILGERAGFSFLRRGVEREDRKRPTAGEAIAWYGVSAVLLFYVGATLQRWSPQLGLALTLWGVVLLPTLGVARYLGLDLRATFNLRRPSLGAIAGAALMGLTLWPIVASLNGVIERSFLPMPPDLVEQMAAFFPAPESAIDWAILLTVGALSPAICEELLFRGFILSGLRRLPKWGAIIASAVLFGVFHLSLHRLFGTTVLGLAMGWIVWRSGTVIASMVFHAVNNAAALVVAHVVDEGSLSASSPPLVAVLVCICTISIGAWLVAISGRGLDSYQTTD